MSSEDHRTVIVTGGNRGIGKAIALSLAGEGYDVIFTFNSGKEEAESTLEEIKKLGVEVQSHQVNLASKDSLKEFTKLLREGEPKLFALVNNAGIYRGTKLDETSNEEWETIVGLNLSAPFLLARSLHDRIIDGGSIVNISSVYGFRADPWAHGYQSTKAALIHLTKGLAKELGPRIRVNCVAPGYVRTDMNRGGWEDESFNSKIRKKTPMSRWGEPEDIARAVKFLIDPSNNFITGHTLVVDGGIGL